MFKFLKSSRSAGRQGGQQGRPAARVGEAGGSSRSILPGIVTTHGAGVKEVHENGWRVASGGWWESWSCRGVGRGRRPFATLPMSWGVGKVECVSQVLAGTVLRAIFGGDFATGPRVTTPPRAGVRTCQLVPPAPGSGSRPAPARAREATPASPTHANPPTTRLPPTGATPGGKALDGLSFSAP